MLDTIELVTAAKQRSKQETGRDSDLALCQKLGWKSARLSSVIRGLRPFTDHEVIQIAEYAGIDPAFALVAIRAEIARDKGSSAAPYWERLARSFLRKKSAA